MNIIARIRNGYKEKFGIPRQSGMVDNVSLVVFEPEYRAPEAVRGLEDFNYIWLIWDFSEAHGRWSPTVRPPVLGGNERMGVFATRSPHRPNPIGLSSVRLLEVREGAEGPVLVVEGADLMDGTPIFDIKPYIPRDCHPDAEEGFSRAGRDRGLAVEIPEEARAKIPAEDLEHIKKLLALDPRPSYHRDPERVYGMTYGGVNVKFKVREGLLTVTEVGPAGPQKD